MNVKTLQRTDRWLGVPLCVAFSAVRACFGSSSSNQPLPPRNILFVKLAEQGSTVLVYAALRRAVQIAGRDNVHFVAFEDNRFILDLLEVIPPQNVITVPCGGITSFVRGLMSAVRRLRRLNLDTAIDMEFFSRGSALLSYLSGARRRVGFHAFFGAGPYRGNLMTHRLSYNPHNHTSQAFLSLVEAALSDPATLPTFEFRPPDNLPEPKRFVPGTGEVKEVEEIVRRHTNGRAPLILLNPNCSDLLPLRRWPAERYVELSRQLLAKYPELVVLFTGAPVEAGAIAELVARVGSNRCVSLAGKTSLRQLLVLYSLAEVLVTNDSGPAHFATLTSVHVVTLFGPETPALFAAQTQRNKVVWAGIACSPCVNAYNNRQTPCRNNLCMQALSVEQIMHEVTIAYDKRKQCGVRPNDES